MSQPALAALAALFYGVHAAVHLARGRAWELLWTCNAGALLVVIGLLARAHPLVAIGTLWLAAGTPLWLADLGGAGGTFAPSSLGVHVGVLAIGVLAVRRAGVPRHAWWQAVLGLVGLFLLTRWLTPPSQNINMAFAVYGPARHITRSYLVYWAGSMALFALAFALLARLGQRLARA